MHEGNRTLIQRSFFQARGIDVQQVSLVINYDLPANRENYIHRYSMYNSNTVMEKGKPFIGNESNEFIVSFILSRILLLVDISMPTATLNLEH